MQAWLGCVVVAEYLRDCFFLAVLVSEFGF